MKLRTFFGISAQRQRQLTRLMELGLAGIFVVGLFRGSIGIVVNSAIAFFITTLPAVLERDHNIPMDAGLTLWITTAVFLHAVGTLGPYQNVWWWDHVTHTLSSSIVAMVGYATTRAIDEHTEDIYFPPRFVFVFILLFVIAFGVLWEVIEFAVGGAATMVGSDNVLTQYSLADTMLDLLFDIIGGILVAIWGTAHLTDIVGALTKKLDASRETN